jgi:hypothetical protein
MLLSTDRARSIEEDLDEAVGDDGLRSSCRRRSAAFPRGRPTVEHEGADGYIAGRRVYGGGLPRDMQYLWVGLDLESEDSPAEWTDESRDSNVDRNGPDWTGGDTSSRQVRRGHERG